MSILQYSSKTVGTGSLEFLTCRRGEPMRMSLCGVRRRRKSPVGGPCFARLSGPLTHWHHEAAMVGGGALAAVK